MAHVESEFKPHPGSVRAAREFVAAALASWHVDDLTEVATILTSELVTNAVLHAGTAFRLAARLTPPNVVVEVWDGSPEPAALCKGDHDADHGRGLLLVDALAAGWGMRLEERGKAVWFSLVAKGAEIPGSLSDA